MRRTSNRGDRAWAFCPGRTLGSPPSVRLRGRLGSASLISLLMLCQRFSIPSSFETMPPNPNTLARREVPVSSPPNRVAGFRE